MAVPAAPVVNSPPLPDRRRRTPARLAPSWSFTEIRTDVDFGAATGGRCDGTFAAVCAAGLATVTPSANTANKPFMVLTLL